MDSPPSVSPPSPAVASPSGDAWRPRPGRLLGDVLVDAGAVSREVVESTVVDARALGRPMGQVLVDRGQITHADLARAVAQRFGLDYLDLATLQIDVTALNLIGPDVARRAGAVPVAFRDDETILVAMSEPANVMAVDDLAMRTGYGVMPAVVSAEDLQVLISRMNRLESAISDATDDDTPAVQEIIEIDDLRTSAEDAPTITLVRSILTEAIDQGASDIHFDPDDAGLRVRFRVDGVLRDSTVIPSRMVAGVISRIKILAELDISERRRPQDGRVSVGLDDREIDMRVNVLPLVDGESAVMRILDNAGGPLPLDKLGISPQDMVRLDKALGHSHGGILSTGPTGSGKSTSLYAILGRIATSEKTILTIEDPVEFRMGDGIKQVQVNPKTNLTFATGLRAMMRADPDIIMVGEMRDAESAQIAVQAAITGHLVLSTLHTNDAPTAVTRLIDMGVEPFLVASAIHCVMGQRLARRLCEHCKGTTAVPGSLVGRPNAETIDIFEPVGCVRCGKTGYKGRVGLYEVMEITDELRSLIVQRASVDRIAEVAIEQGMRPLREDGLEKVRDGLTSLAEVVRTVGS